MEKKSKKNPAKPGRPAVNGPTRMRSLRFPDADWAQWITAAEAEGISVTQWLVRAARRALRRR